MNAIRLFTPPMMASGTKLAKPMTYDANTIEILEDLEHVRKRPEMYIGDVGIDGLHHLLKEVVDNAVDEYLDGHVTEIFVAVHTQKRIAEVRDNGRGIPVDMHPKAGIPTLTAVFTKLHAGGKFGQGAYTGSVVGLHGIGVKAVNALSSRLEVRTVRETPHKRARTFQQSFSRGKPLEDIKAAEKPLRAGTAVKFQPDSKVFGAAQFKPDRIASWLREVAYLCPGLAIRFRSDLTEPQTFQATDGLLNLLEAEQGASQGLHKPILVKTDLVDVALVWTDAAGEQWRSFVNVSPTPDHGTHVQGVKAAVMEVLNSESKTKHRGEDLRDGLLCCVHAHVPEPKFRGQTKTRLENPELVKQVQDAIEPALRDFSLHNKKAVRGILDRAEQLRDARKQFRAKQKAIKGTKISKDATGFLPGKLIEAPDCPASERELYIVEGDSALGTVRNARLQKTIKGRKIHYQEIFPLKGKPLNTVRGKQGLAKVLANQEIKSLVLALGTGVGDSFDLERMRCSMVYLLTDADPDGRHIQALLLSFFAHYMPDLIAEDRVRIVLSPLFMGVSKDKRVYGDTVDEVKKQLGNVKYRIQRFKGLGESNAEDLRVYAMDARTRKVLRVGWDGEDDHRLVLSYMGEDTAARKEILGIVG